jgi:hypothetical protein
VLGTRCEQPSGPTNKLPTEKRDDVADCIMNKACSDADIQSPYQAKSAMGLKLADRIVQPKRFGYSDRKDVAFTQSKRAYHIKTLPF